MTSQGHLKHYSKNNPVGVFLRCRWENLDKNRYYEVFLSKDLFGDWCLTRVWGRKNTSLGQIKHDLYESFESGLTYIEHLGETRLKHGYHLIYKKVNLSS